MIPFRLTIEPGIPIHEQVAFEAKKAMMSVRLKQGDPFPSVRALSRELKIHVNTAMRVVAALTQEGLLEVRPGIGTIVCQPPPARRAERSRALGPEIDQVAVEAMKMGLSLEEFQKVVEERWRRLQPGLETTSEQESEK